MSLRRSVGFILTRMFSPSATPRTAPARSLHSLRDLPIADGLPGAAGVAVAALAGGGTLAVQYFRKGPDDDESAARKKEEDMYARFQDWAKKNNKTYRDEGEKAARFQVFKETVEWIESQPPSAQVGLLPRISYFADFTVKERERMTLGHHVENSKEFQEDMKEFWAKQEKGELLSRRKPAMKQGDMRPKVSA
ncbi:uncharacterized protein LOC124683133 isoform X1 [Lolium rigidum]|uniref:uncharacterized protein LOC124683133 isoform X1 n=1 Tax=Lolium rigidum TaxID=89674 RepID=UPI001F5D3D35|nr:uncharacterized protein LOC124683133 isoform X1 [Lolium rigidum]